MAYGSTLTFKPAWLATYRSASPSGILSSVTVIRAPAGPLTGAITGDPPGLPAGAPVAGGACAAAPATGVPVPVGSATGIEDGAICPRGTSRNTMFTPCPEG